MMLLEEGRNPAWMIRRGLFLAAARCPDYYLLKAILGEDPQGIPRNSEIHH